MPASVASAGGARVVVESEQIRAEFSTRGAVLLSWTLKTYPGAHGHALDLLPVGTNANAPAAFSLTTCAPNTDRARMVEEIVLQLQQQGVIATADGPGTSSRVVLNLCGGGMPPPTTAARRAP
jgi:hypothetical protein